LATTLLEYVIPEYQAYAPNEVAPLLPVLLLVDASPLLKLPNVTVKSKATLLEALVTVNLQLPSATVEAGAVVSPNGLE
jgi:hypothetical protein